MNIQLHNVSKYYQVRKRKVLAVDNVSLELHMGIFLLTGGNASGKSTLLRLMAGISKPSSGYVQVGKHKLFIDCQGDCLSRLRMNYIGFMPQTLLVPKSMRADKASGLPLILKNIDGWRDIVKKHFEDFGLLDIMDRKCGQLSVGQRQRIAFIRSIILDPPIILLDEPFSHQDEEYIKKIIEYLNLVSENKLIVVATPDTTIVKHYRLNVHKSIVLFRGKVKSIKAFNLNVD